VKQKASETVSTEIRAHLKAAPNRINLVRQAIKDGDDEVACAVRESHSIPSATIAADRAGRSCQHSQ